MRVPVVDVRVMRVVVRHRLMPVWMRVRLAGRVVGVMEVLVVRVVDVRMGVFQCLMGVRM